MIWGGGNITSQQDMCSSSDWPEFSYLETHGFICSVPEKNSWSQQKILHSNSFGSILFSWRQTVSKEENQRILVESSGYLWSSIPDNFSSGYRPALWCTWWKTVIWLPLIDIVSKCKTQGKRKATHRNTQFETDLVQNGVLFSTNHLKKYGFWWGITWKQDFTSVARLVTFYDVHIYVWWQRVLWLWKVSDQHIGWGSVCLVISSHQIIAELGTKKNVVLRRWQNNHCDFCWMRQFKPNDDLIKLQATESDVHVVLIRRAHFPKRGQCL